MTGNLFKAMSKRTGVNLVAVATSSRFRIRILGPFELLDLSGRRVSLATRKTEALVALLAFGAPQSAARDWLCSLLWPGVPEPQALHSLRQTLLGVRKTVPGLVRSTTRDVVLDPDRVEVDLLALMQQLTLATRASLTACEQLYRGELLEGMALREPPFAAWLESERLRIRESVTRGLLKLVELHAETGDVATAIGVCSKLLQLNPFGEQSHRALMRLQLRQGDRASAIAHYRRLAEVLQRELGVEPDVETKKLYVEIEQAALPAVQDSPGYSPGHESRAHSIASIASIAAIAPPSILRPTELGVLRNARARSLEGQALVCAVSGEAGVGKTHLCDQFTREVEASAARVLRARCFESEQILPFSLFSNLLAGERLAQEGTILDELPEPVRAELARLSSDFGSPSGPERLRDPLPLFRALESLLTLVARGVHVAFILEDLQWADDISLRMFCYIVRRIPALWIVTHRSEDVPAGAFLLVALSELEREGRLVRLELAPFERPDADELAARWANALGLSIAHDDWIRQVWSIGEGNPLVIAELARTRLEETLEPGLERLPVPERVRALIRRRVQRLGDSARALLSIAAVYGAELDASVAAVLLDEARVSTAEEELIAHALMRPRGGRLGFVHDRIRETVYAEMFPLRRSALHGRIAVALESRQGTPSSTTLGQIGYHYSKAGEAAAAIPYLIRFAEHAQQGHALGEALAALDQALRDTEALPEAARAETRIGITVRMALCLAFLGRSNELVTILSERARELVALGRPELTAMYHFWWAFGLTTLGDTKAAEHHARVCLETAAADGDTRGLSFAHGILAYLCAMHGQWREGVRHGIKSIELVAAEATIVEAPVLAAVNTLLNYLWLGDWRNALAMARLAWESAERADSQRGRSLAASAEAMVHAYVERWQPALDAARRAVEVSDSPLTLGYALWSLASAQIGSGDLQPAIAMLEGMNEHLTPRNLRSLRVSVLTLLAEARLRAGDLRAARRLIEEALGDAGGLPNPLMYGTALRVSGAVELGLGNLEAAHAHYESALSTFGSCEAPIDIARTRTELANLHLARNDRNAALAELRRAEDLYRKFVVEEPLHKVSARIAALTSSPIA